MSIHKENQTLLFTLEYPPFRGGVASYYGNLTKFWGEGILVLADGQKKELDASNVIYRPLVSNWLWPHWLPAFWHLFRVIKYSKFHVIVGHILPLGTVCYFLSKIFKFKYYVVLHGMDFTYAIKTSRKKKITKKILNKSTGIICANSYTANLVKNFHADLAAKTAIINPGIDTHIIRNPKKVEELKNKYNLKDKIILLSIGRLVKRKGVDKTIEAMPEVLKNFSNLSYIIAGDGEEGEAFRAQAEKLPEEIKNKIIFLGKISDEEKSAWLEACDIFIMPSRKIGEDFEGFGIVYLEANLFGKPVIAGESGGVAEAVINNVTGLIVDPEKKEKIAEAILKLAQDEKLRYDLGEGGKRRVVVNFDWKKQIEKIKKFLNG